MSENGFLKIIRQNDWFFQVSPTTYSYRQQQCTFNKLKIMRTLQKLAFITAFTALLASCEQNINTKQAL